MYDEDGRRLTKTGKTEEFNRQFQDNIDMGVFRRLSHKELEVYKGLTN
jgi:hypothetical protein